MHHEIVYDKITWESKGFGFVTFKKKEDAEKAMVGLDGKELVGKKIIVIEAVEKRFWSGKDAGKAQIISICFFLFAHRAFSKLGTNTGRDQYKSEDKTEILS